MLPQKCATTTLQIRLRGISDVSEYGGTPQYNEELGKLLTKHVTAKDASKLQAYQSRSDYYKACFVRNPYDRIYSWFNWIIKNNEKQLIEIEQDAPTAPLSANEQFVYKNKLKYILHMQKRLEKVNYDFNRFVQKKPEQFKAISKYTHLNQVCQMDRIGHVETFEKDFETLCKQIHFEPRSKANANVLGKDMNSSNHETRQPQYINKYTRKTLRIINKTFAADFKNFNYSTISS